MWCKQHASERLGVLLSGLVFFERYGTTEPARFGPQLAGCYTPGFTIWHPMFSQLPAPAPDPAVVPAPAPGPVRQSATPVPGCAWPGH